eukprot:TRINITY_DN18380_c0_g1_i1.p1 TRINITY_DN18380_c0_g1~~TRINITY_DN18380_c0_g1_i1.p1  ORF type:complete len:520 (+),score=120.28 TRINITY_DN18380_c0_g1_i1:73-1632(+)
MASPTSAQQQTAYVGLPSRPCAVPCAASSLVEMAAEKVGVRSALQLTADGRSDAAASGAQAWLDKQWVGGTIQQTLTVAIERPDEEAAEDVTDLSVNLPAVACGSVVPFEQEPERLQMMIEEALAVLSAAASGEDRPVAAARPQRTAGATPVADGCASVCRAGSPERAHGVVHQGALGIATLPAHASADDSCKAAAVDNGSSIPVGSVQPDDAALPAWAQELDLVSWQKRGALLLLQPRVSKQWHPNSCGYHALHNARLLTELCEQVSATEVEQPSQNQQARLQDGRLFMRELFTMMRWLRRHPLDTGGSSWRPEFLRTCTLDQCHLRRLMRLQGGAACLDERLFVVESDTFAGDLGPADDAIRQLLSQEGEHKPVGVVFGAVQHWLTIVVGRTPSGFAVFVSDSHNKPLLTDRLAADVAQAATESVYERFKVAYKLEQPRYAEAPEEVFRDLWENGVPEWWKGQVKPDKAWWRHRPAALRALLTEMEVNALHNYLEMITKVAGAVAASGGEEGAAAED